LCDNLGHHRFDKHAIAHRTIKVTLSLNASIVFARLVLQLNAYPFSNLKVSGAHETNDGLGAIV
jgi:hypothetical protein